MPIPVDAEPSILANDARCYSSCIPMGMQPSVVISLLAELLLIQDPMADVTARTLAKSASCYSNCIPPGEQLAVMNYLLYQIWVNGGGGGGGGGINLWTKAAGNPPVDGSVTTPFYKNTTNGIKYANLASVAAPDWDTI